MEDKKDIKTEETEKERKPVLESSNKIAYKTNWLFVGIISLLISVSSIFVYDRFFVQKIVAVDLKGFIAEQRDLYLAGKINDDQFKANVDRVEMIISSIPKNKVVIMGDAVVRNAEEIELGTKK